MILFSNQNFSKDMKTVRIFEIRTQLNISLRISYSPQIPLTLELGLGIITFSYEIWKS